MGKVTLEELRKKKAFPDGRFLTNDASEKISNKNIEDLSVEMSGFSSTNVIGGIWKNVEFNIKSNCTISFSNCRFINVSFTNDDPAISGVKLTLQRCDVQSSSFDALWLKINFSACTIEDVKFQKILSDDFTSNDTHLKDVTVKFFRVKNVNLNKVVFDGGDWSPFRTENIVLNDVRFNETKVNIASIINNCTDRSKINLQNANVIDQWANLRDKYTGFKLIVVFLLTLAFILPYLIKSLFYIISSGVIEKALLDMDKQPLWQALLLNGRDLNDGKIIYVYAGAGIILLIYNIVRFFITLYVLNYREREEHLSMYGFKVIRPDENSCLFKFISMADRLQLLLGSIALISALWKMWDILMLDVIKLNNIF